MVAYDAVLGTSRAHICVHTYGCVQATNEPSVSGVRMLASRHQDEMDGEMLHDAKFECAHGRVLFLAYLHAFDKTMCAQLSMRGFHSVSPGASFRAKLSGHRVHPVARPCGNVCLCATYTKPISVCRSAEKCPPAKKLSFRFVNCMR